MARHWVEQGAEWLHVVNLDGALGATRAQINALHRPNTILIQHPGSRAPETPKQELQRELPINLQRLREIRQAVAVPIQFGGGLRTTDDMPYGGSQGMVMKCEPIFAAVEALRRADSRVVLMTPAGRRFDQATAVAYSTAPHLIVLCGHYEGIDQRAIDHLVDDEISIGDYVLTNGAIAAVVVIDAVVRLIPGVLGDENSAPDDSFSSGLLEFPQYTRPVEFRGWRVADVVVSGQHA